MKNNKILGLLLAGVMVTSIPFNVFADGEQTSTPTGPTVAGHTAGNPTGNQNTGAPGSGGTQNNTGKFTVTFNSNGGSEVNEVQSDNEGKVTKPADPKKQDMNSRAGMMEIKNLISQSLSHHQKL